jgi:hypothetical protein
MGTEVTQLVFTDHGRSFNLEIEQLAQKWPKWPPLTKLKVMWNSVERKIYVSYHKSMALICHEKAMKCIINLIKKLIGLDVKKRMGGLLL